MAIGNFMEWFDFAVFGALVDVISQHFFPAEEDSVRFLKTVAIFGAGFIMRPVGGMFIGWIGDTVGRRVALEISILLMLLPSFLIGCLPTYKHIGWWAPALLMLLRLIQGLAAGGELVGALIFTLESTGGKHTGFWGGACKATGNLGSTVGIGVAALLRTQLSADELQAWGWRVPFLLGIVFGVIGLIARKSLDAVGEDEGHGQGQGQQVKYRELLRILFRDHLRDILTVVFVAATWGCGYYTCFVWIAYYMQDEALIGGTGGVPFTWSLCFAANLCLVAAMPLGGLLGDYLSQLIPYPGRARKMVLQMAVFILMASVLPAFLLFRTKQLSCATIGMLLLVIPVGIFGGNLPIYMITHFERSLRFSGVGIAYNLAAALFSSTVAVVQTSLIFAATKGRGPSSDHMAIASPHLLPAYYLMFVALLTFTALQLDSEEPHALTEELEDKDYDITLATLEQPSSPTAPAMAKAYVTVSQYQS